jgi:DNA (cytosine-5)-methyltransferase 1
VALFLFLERATNVDITKELPTVISFCSGYGGLERGLDLAGVEHRVIAFLEIEAFAIANLVNKMEDGIIPPAPIYTDLKTVPAHLFRDRVDIITGGYPCQPFSAAGKRLGEDDPRHLWPFIRRHVQTIRPSRVFFENVEGHISLGLSSVISDLEEDGYGATWGIFSAREVGAPHQRKRVYILANRNGIRCDWGKLPDTASQRTVEIETQQGSGQPLVRSEAEGCGGDNGKDELADSKSIGIQRLWPSRFEKSDSHGKAELSLRQSQRPKYASWDAEPRVGRVVDGCANRVDRTRLLGNGIVPQTAAKAWEVLAGRISNDS